MEITSILSQNQIRNFSCYYDDSCLSDLQTWISNDGMHRTKNYFSNDRH